MELLQRSAAVPGGSGQGTSCNARAYLLGGHGVLPRGRSLPIERNSFNALPRCLGAVGSGTHVMHCPAAWERRTVQFLQYTATLLGGNVRWNSCYALLLYPGALASGTAAMHCLTAERRWSLELLQCTASLPGQNGQ